MSRKQARSKPPAATVSPPRPEPDASAFWTRPRLALAVVALLLAPWSLAVLSLVQENPTIDEVVHLPAGLSYWQKGTFKLYPHNPPLVKLVAALPVLRANPDVERMYNWPRDQPPGATAFWDGPSPNKAGIAHVFQQDNAPRYFELFTSARLLMPTFALIGGLAVFLWSRAMFGSWGGLLSLALWGFCPNILAHARLITSDVGATALGFAATFAYWRFLRESGWPRALLAGGLLGLAALTKFSIVLLYGLWPAIWGIWLILEGRLSWTPRRIGRDLLYGLAIIAMSVLVIDAGYGFEEVGRPLGDLPFVSGTLTVKRPHPEFQNPRPVDLLGRIHEYRINRFRGTLLGGLPVPLPRYYLTGFDEQKLEADGVWARFLVSPEIGDRMGIDGEAIYGYPVYLDGKLSQTSWWSYYLFTLLYKVPEGTWTLVLLSAIAAIVSQSARATTADEVALLLVPVFLFALMSFGTNINLGLRYVLPVFPYVFVAVGRLGPWVVSRVGLGRRLAMGAIAAGLLLTVAATARAHPHYLAYFNDVSGGTAGGSEHLIDSNLDWGQDLVGLREWIREHAPDESIGLAYFGQIHPNLFTLRDDPIHWYLPPARSGKIQDRGSGPPYSHRPGRPGEALRPGLYAVSASLVRGLDWRVYDHAYQTSEVGGEWGPWEARRDAFSYFKEFTPIARIGGSIFVYRLNEQDVEKASARLVR